MEAQYLETGRIAGCGVRCTVLVQVIYHIAQRLAELHASGYVHRDLKPANVMWLPRANRWTVIDFGCVARTGESARIACTLRYAAPEVLKAKRGCESHVEVKESLDAWSLGVMAYELTTGTSAFPTGCPQETVRCFPHLWRHTYMLSLIHI